MKEIKSYWNERALNSHGKPNATTDDIFLRKLEEKTIINQISKNYSEEQKFFTLDLGCGDGATTLKIAENFPNSSITGLDFSEAMIENANNNSLKKKYPNVCFEVGDLLLLKENLINNCDVVLTDRSLINLKTFEEQKTAIRNIYLYLKNGGVYIGIENFLESHNKLNKERSRLNLSKIDIRWHNHYFIQDDLSKHLKSIFSDSEISTFSSSYYVATRLLYSMMCSLNNDKIDYNHIIHQIAVDLPECGYFSPIKLIVARK